MDDFQVEPQRVIDALVRENAELSRKYAYVSAAFDQIVAAKNEEAPVPPPRNGEVIDARSTVA